MALPKGTRLGPYEVLALIGEGGMGQVYRATDTRLNRTVAIKVLPAHFTDNSEMKERFEREAQTVAGLNHPHICTLHDVGYDNGTDYLVMEFLAGETLADRLERGPLPLPEALKVGTEIADALEKAHRHGVVHRDLKPANIMLTKTGSKLLDFGLAKMKPATVQSTSLSALPTNANATAQGTILGTLQYMAPEQLEGREADARTDIFAFGALMYEMVTGKKAFEGRSHASLISSIMTAEPRSLAEYQPLTPPAVEHIVRMCLRKEPEDRWQTAHDLVLQLQWLSSEGAQIAGSAPAAERPEPRRKLFWWVLSGVVALLVIGLAIPAFMYLGDTSSPDEIRFLLTTPNMPGPYSVSISPDGRQIAFVASAAANETSIFIRELGSTALRELPGTDGATQPFWSPDSRFIAFSAKGTLKKIDLSGGSPQNICNGGAAGTSTGTWNKDGTIIYSAKNILYRVSAAGGDPVALTSLNTSNGETHFWPSFLPDGRHYLYTVWASESSNRGIYVGALNSQERTQVAAIPSMAVYALGYLFYQREGMLFAQRFDAKALTLSGEPFRVADRMLYSGANGRAAFAIADTGTLVYRAGTGTAARQRFSWFDRSGRETGSVGEPGPYTNNFSLSPDTKQLAVSILDADANRSDLWVMDLASGVTSRLTRDSLGAQNGRDVVWSPDGLQLAFTTSVKGNQDISLIKASGVGQERALVASPDAEFVEDWSADGKYIVYGAWAPVPTDLWAVLLTGDRKPFPVVQSPFRKDEPHFSFDGKWLAYNSEESGRWEIYVTSFPAGDQKRQISTNGGAQPRWRRDGKELYYLTLDGQMMAVDIATTPAISSGAPHVLFDTGLVVEPTIDQYAATADGQRFLILKPVAGPVPTPITVVVNWKAPQKK